MKSKLLAAVASLAFVAAGVAAQAQENPKHDQRPAAERSQPATAPKGAEMQRKEAPKAAEEQRKEGPKTAEEQRKEAPKAAEEQRKEGPKAAEMQRKEGQKAAEEQRKEAPKAAEEQKTREMDNRNEAQRPAAKGEENRRMAEPAKGERAPAERTGANEREHNAQRTAERPAGQPRVVGDVKMSTEHATRVSEFLRRGARPENVNIAIRVGVRVPEDVVVQPLPPDVIALVPEYRGYDYFIDSNDEIVFVAPETHEVVGMIDYEGRAAAVDTQRMAGARPCPIEQ